MHVAVAALCRMLDIAANPPTHLLRSRIDSIMQLASASQASFEARRTNHPRMLSIHEIMLECSIDLPRLGILSQELILVSSRQLLPLAAASQGECCLIRARDLPLRLSGKGVPCAATATANGHTVCLIHYASGKFAMFDSAPGLLALNMDADGLLKRLDAALGCLDRADGPEEPKQQQQGSVLYRRGKKVFVDEREAELATGRKKQRVLPGSGGGSDSYDADQQCDITLFWKRE